MSLIGCANVQERVIVVNESNCDLVPRIGLTLDEIDIIILDSRLHDLLDRVDKQEQVIDVCNSSDHLVK